MINSLPQYTVDYYTNYLHILKTFLQSFVLQLNLNVFNVYSQGLINFWYLFVTRTTIDHYKYFPPSSKTHIHIWDNFLMYIWSCYFYFGKAIILAITKPPNKSFWLKILNFLTRSSVIKSRLNYSIYVKTKSTMR